MIDERLADQLIERTLGWRSALDRYTKPGRGWTPRSKFRPLEDVRDALRLVIAVTHDYSLVAKPGSPITAHVRIAGRVGTATGEPMPRTICLALARALGIISDGGS